MQTLIKEELNPKKQRRFNAKPLPDGITQSMLETYVVYYDERNSKQPREYFKIEKYPKLKKIWIGTKSKLVTITEKLKQANKMVQYLKIYEVNEFGNSKPEIENIIPLIEN